MAADAVARFFSDLRVKRTLSLGAFLFLLILFRHLVPLLVFFLIFARGFDFLSHHMGRLSRLPPKAMVVLLVLLTLGTLGLGAFLGVHRALPALSEARHSVPERIEALKQTDAYRQLEGYKVHLEKQMDRIKHGVAMAMGYLQATGRILFQALIGFILAMLYLLEKKHMDEWMASLPMDSYADMVIHYFKVLSDAIIVTVKLQVVVGLVNAVVTGLILKAIGMHNALALAAMVFVFGLVPVLGNFLSGAIIIVLCYLHKGVPLAVAFVVLTFILHKFESYFLTPRLASKHVNMPSLAIVTSLILFEHLFGVAGLFMSFPALYVAYGVRAYFRGQLNGEAPMALSQEGLATAASSLGAPTPSLPAAPSGEERSDRPV